jgi:hypothetical protein
MRASDGGTARRMETKKGLPKQSFFQVVLPGFEPGQAEPKTAVLPLHHKTILTNETHRPKSGAKICRFFLLCKFLRHFFKFLGEDCLILYTLKRKSYESWRHRALPQRCWWRKSYKNR